MIMVSIGHLAGHQLRLCRVLRSETAVMLTTVFITVLSHISAIGVAADVSCFSRKIASGVCRHGVEPEMTPYIQRCRTDIFRLSRWVYRSIRFQRRAGGVTINLTHAHIWDQAAVAAIDVIKFRRNGAEVELVGLNEASITLLNKLAPRQTGCHRKLFASHQIDWNQA